MTGVQTCALPILAPSAAEIDWPGRGTAIRAGVLLQGDPAGAPERAERMRELLGGTPGAGGAAVGTEPPAWWGLGAAAAGDGTLVRIAFWAAELPSVLAALRAAADDAGLDPAVSGSAAAGVLHAAVPPGAAPGPVAEFLAALRAALRPGRASAVVLRAPAPVREAVDLWGPVPSLSLMRAVKDQFDPGHRMAPGRFAGGI